jgi:hypothetical protein
VLPRCYRGATEVRRPGECGVRSAECGSPPPGVGIGYNVQQANVRKGLCVFDVQHEVQRGTTCVPEAACAKREPNGQRPGDRGRKAEALGQVRSRQVGGQKC